MSMEAATAGSCAANTSNISGYVMDYNGTGIAGVTISNQTNLSITTTTDSTGYFNLSCVNETNVGIDTDVGATSLEDTLLIKASGFTETTALYNLEYNATIVDGTTFFNDTFEYAGHNITLKYITPSLSGAASSGVTRTTASYTWTVATPTDNVTNLYVGSRVIWGASGIPNETKAFSNSTLAPSFSFTNLREGNTYTVYYETYNIANNAHRTMGSTTFTTLKSNMGAILAEEQSVTTPAKPSGTLEILTSPNKTPQQRNIIIVVIVAIISIIVYYGYLVQGSGKSGGKSNGKRRK